MWSLHVHFPHLNLCAATAILGLLLKPQTAFKTGATNATHLYGFHGNQNTLMDLCAATAIFCQLLQSPTALKIGATNVTHLFGIPDRQKSPKASAFFVVPFTLTNWGFSCKKNTTTSVCPSSTICVCKHQKWYEHFVRGTIGTENSLNTHISRLGPEVVTNT